MIRTTLRHRSSRGTSGRRAGWLRVAALTAASALALAACGETKDSDSDENAPESSDSAGASDGAAALSLDDVSVQLSWIKNAEFAGEFYADSKGYYTDEGFKKVTLTAGPTTTENLVAAGKATFGLSNAVSVAQAVANEQAPIKIVGTTYQKNPFTILSIADKGDIKTPQDMVGKKIGVQASNQTLFDALLAANDIDAGDVTVVPVDYDPSVLVDGQVDGFVAYLTNESIIVQSEGEEVTNLPFADNGLPFVAESIIASDETIADHPDTVKAFLAAEIKGWQDACADPAGGAALALDTYGTDLDLDLKKETQQAQIQCDDLVNTDETAQNGIFTISDDLITQNMETLAGANIDLTDPADLFDTSLLTELLEDQPDLIP